MWTSSRDAQSDVVKSSTHIIERLAETGVAKLSVMLKGLLLYLGLCLNYFYLIHGGGRWGEFPKENYFSALIKTLPCLGLTFLTWRNDVTDDAHKRLKNNVTLGLFFSVLGDVCMVWRFDRVLQGMFFFAIAHLFYARAFRFKPLGDATTAVTCLMPGLLLFVFIVLPNIPEASVKVCGLLYSTIISLMWWRCVVYFKSTKKTTMVRACVGAVVFMTSDFLICIDTWVMPLPYASLIIMITYYTAQFLIASSVLEYRAVKND